MLTRPHISRIVSGVFVFSAALTNAQTATAATLLVTTSGSPSTVDLTTEGALDWVHWSYNSGVVLDRKLGGSQFAGITYVNNNAKYAATDANAVTTFSWEDGSATVANPGTTDGLALQNYGSQNVLQFQAPADSTERMLALYVDLRGNSSPGSLTATLSGGQTQTIAIPKNGYGDQYSKVLIDYADAGSNTLSVTFATGNGEDYVYPEARIFGATLSAVPEPTTLSAAGLAILGAVRRRRPTSHRS